jgi:hypothetical protein
VVIVMSILITMIDFASSFFHFLSCKLCFTKLVKISF